MENASSQSALDARHLADQLPAGFARGDEATLDAVMQLAAFTEQQHQHHQQHPNGSDSLHDAVEQSQDEKSGRKRKSESTGTKQHVPEKIQKDDENQDTAAAAHHQNWASFTSGDEANQFEQLLHQSEGQGNNEGQQSMDDSLQEGISTSDAEMLTRHGRPLSSTKRAAQNRAAQRAFRERRDQHVKEVEIKAKQVDQALASAAMHKQRYDELLKTIAELRADNSSLRMAINALGGNAPPPPPVVSFPNLDLSQEVDSSAWGEVPFNSSQHQSSDDKSDNHLDGLSAVAAAAAAAATAAAHAAHETDSSKESTKNGTEQH